MRPDRAGGTFRCEARLERELRARGFQAVAGVDEVGRGSLFGPVFAAAVILNPRRRIVGLDDSKKLSPQKREVLAERIRAHAIAWCVAQVDARQIDAERIASRVMGSRRTRTPSAACTALAMAAG